jgi:carboxypeptidase C (cathepsin A)
LEKDPMKRALLRRGRPESPESRRLPSLPATKRVLAAALLCLLLIPGSRAEEAGSPAGVRIPIGELDAVPATHVIGLPSTGRSHAASARPEQPLPVEAASHHSLELPGRALAFTTKAGAIVFEDDKGVAVAEIGYFAYLLDGADPRKRPITFVINGGPGSASAWLHLGALGPWRLPITQASAHPSAGADLLPNAETWLDFTDLVFIDPVGTGYSRLHQRSADAAASRAKDETAEAPRKRRKAGAGQDAQALREKFWSVQGDNSSVVVFIKRWLQAGSRTDSPKVLVGESYGGFRAPRIAQALQAMPGLALNGFVLISPALAARGADFPGLGGALTRAAQFPSLAATIADAKGPVSPEQLAAFEREAAGGYLADLMAGPRDDAAVERLAARIAAVTGLDVDRVRRLGPRSAPQVFLGAIDRASGRASSNYDATEKRLAAYDGPALIDGGDDLSGLSVQLARAMGSLTQGPLGWKPGREYHVRGQGVGWSWSGQESLTALRSVLVRDPAFRVLIVHGYADLVTPYFRTKLMLDQLPTIGADNSRVRLEVYGGGHMFYSRDASRARFRADALRLYEEISGGGQTPRL